MNIDKTILEVLLAHKWVQNYRYMVINFAMFYSIDISLY
jgi:hypothetical protein